jgi:hypothetical protein
MTMLLARVREAEQQYEQAKRELLRSLQDLAAEYGEEAASGLEEGLADVDREIAEVRAAVAQGQDELAYRLTGLYRSQTGALERASSLVHSVAYQEE